MEQRSRRILVVEDEGAVRRLVARHLSRQGHEVAEASDAEEVLLRMSQDREPFDLVLSDIHLPGLSGVELLRLVLNHSPMRPVIMITGDADETLARRALNYGATGYLLKPFELAELDAAVQQAVSRLELVEAAESLVRSDGGALPDCGERTGVIPTAWLELADQRSSAGSGHGYRVARIAGVVASRLEDALGADERQALDVAARAHELGRLLDAQAAQVELTDRTVQILADLGVAEGVRTIVRHLHERWDGSGGPAAREGEEIPVSSMVVGIADALDHLAVMHLESGLEPAASVAAALDEVHADAPKLYGPTVAEGAMEAASVIEAIWVLARGAADDRTAA